ncbi:hypothetical protein EJV46_03560 [Roseococcus sp. SYP-B2431]|uniref:hypothetical protein n=1 Tax=Roseococcus sp. SYP-B2431 TaxID=2496640 RepID=UPI00103F2552|nr:hypothetical protein [Roseococcus sp. SYP-B2431]TCH99760.1 hypothetical protein EJV46_03560 [Roseococcus sp. SYP-B2431]
MQGCQGQPRAVIVHGAEEVGAALALAGGRPLALLSAPGAAGYIGVAGFRAILEAHDALGLGILDAADAPGHALAALKAGFAAVVLSPEAPAFGGLRRIAAGLGARLLEAPPPALDLARVDLGKPQGRRHLARWLGLPGAEELP